MKATGILLIVCLSTGAHAAEFTAKVQKIGALTGPAAPVDMRAPDICGTDLGTMAEIGGRIVFAFGDTFGWRGSLCSRFGPNWRSNAIAYTRDLDPSDGVSIEGWVTGQNGQAIAVAAGKYEPAFKGEQTRIPTSLLAVGNRLFLHTMSVKGFADEGGAWLCNSSRFYYSDDEAKTWTPASTFGDYKSAFNMLALSAQSGAGNEDGGYAYAIGTACGRFAGARLARVPVGKVIDPAAWEYFDGKGWSPRRADAAEIIKPGVGEGSLIWNAGIQRWMYTTLNELSSAVELRLAAVPTGPWSDPIALARLVEFPEAYGAFMTPSWISKDGLTLYFVMSQFGPYNTFVMKAELTRS